MTETPSSVWEYVDTLNHHEIVYMYNSIEPTKKKGTNRFSIPAFKGERSAYKCSRFRNQRA